MAAHQAPPSLGFSGRNTRVGCHFLLQCMKVKSEREVTQSCPTVSNPMDCSPPGSSVHGIFQARVLEWGAIAGPIRRVQTVMALAHRWPWAKVLDRESAITFFVGSVLWWCSVAKLYPTLCNPLGCSTRGFPILHYLLVVESLSHV